MFYLDELEEALSMSMEQVPTMLGSINTAQTKKCIQEKLELQEALRSIVHGVHIIYKKKVERFFYKAKGVSYTYQDTKFFRQFLIKFSQDPNAIMGLRNALAMLKKGREAF